MAELNQRAFALGVPLSAHLDVTYRCNERCEHCYLDHDDHGEMSRAEIFDLLRQLADAGVFFLTLSGGEPLFRRDCFDIIAEARRLQFSVKLKTNAVLIGVDEARRMRELGVEGVQVSVYSHKAEVHDAVTKLPRSFERTIAGIRALIAAGVNVTIANVLMRANVDDALSVRALADDLGAAYTLDPTITPMMNGDTDVLRLRVSAETTRAIFREPTLVGDVDAFCTPPGPVDDSALDGVPCSAGHTAVYVSPYGDVYPCVQFPLASGNVRRQSFASIWRDSPQLAEVRSIRGRDLTTCSGCGHLGSCTRCPGLAFLEGNMRGPSSADCEKSELRTGITPASKLASSTSASSGGSTGLVQIARTRRP